MSTQNIKSLYSRTPDGRFILDLMEKKKAGTDQRRNGFPSGICSEPSQIPTKFFETPTRCEQQFYPSDVSFTVHHAQKYCQEQNVQSSGFNHFDCHYGSGYRSQSRSVHHTSDVEPSPTYRSSLQSVNILQRSFLKK